MRALAGLALLLPAVAMAQTVNGAMGHTQGTGRSAYWAFPQKMNQMQLGKPLHRSNNCSWRMKL